MAECELLGCWYADRSLSSGTAKNRSSAVDFGRQRPIEGEIEKKKRRKRKKKKRRRRKPSAVLARVPSSPVGRTHTVIGRALSLAFSPARGEKIEATELHIDFEADYIKAATEYFSAYHCMVFLEFSSREYNGFWAFVIAVTKVCNTDGTAHTRWYRRMGCFRPVTTRNRSFCCDLLCSAFCNYADIEAFTEEKKKSLLLKRQGKGSDFVRAVDEIIDIYETSKKPDLYESNSGNVKVEPCAENLKLVGTRSNSFSFRNRLELGSHVDSDRKLETACDLEETNDMVGSEEVSATSTADDSQKDLVIDEPLQMVNVLDQLRQNSLGASITSKKKRFRDDSQDSSFLQKSVPSRRGFRSSLVADSSIAQESTSVYDSDLSGDLIPDVILGLNAESKSKQHASHTSNFHVMDVACAASMPSNGCREETGTEIVAKDYEACQLNIGVVESRCLHEASTNGCLGDKDKLNRNIELATKSSVHTKIKSNRKQVNDAAECAVLNKEDDLQVVLGSSPPNSFKEMKEINQKADGDEHLPLVKRARVRMGKPVAEETQHGELICGDEKLETSTVVNNCDEQHTSPTFTNTSVLEGTLLTGKEDLNSSLLNSCSPPSGKVLMFWKAKNYQLKDCMLDVEAALPPSKRLHRALEAMSANATEATESHTESTRAIEANIFMASDAKFGSPVRLRSICSSDCDTHAISTAGSVSQNLDIPSLASSEVQTHDILTEIEIVRRPQNKDCNKILQNVTKCNGFGITQKESPQPYSSKSAEEVNVTPSDNLADKARLSLDKTNKDMMEDKDGSHHACVDHINRDESVELVVHKQDAFLNADGGIHFVPPDEAVRTVSVADMVSMASSTSGATMSSFQSDEESQTVNM
ncbi:hypothetical protein GW17_00019666 [Ensete ventricosum]|nr:hypothetical protein GW17_00019666 [Ensete ventricosum]